MEKIDEQLKNLSSAEIPAGIHQSVMRGVNFRRMQPTLLIVFCLLALNFLAIAWHINSKLVDAEFSDMMGDFFNGFELSFSFVGTILGSFFEIISPALVLSLLFSLGGVIYVGRKITSGQFARA